MENITVLFYNTISNKSLEMINVIKDYLSGNNMNKYHKIRENNLCAQEKILIFSEMSNIGITENSYIYNGYILNSSDRIIITDMKEGSGISYSGTFAYVSDPKKPESLIYLNSFCFNKQYLDNIDIESDTGNIKIFRLAYNIAGRYFRLSMKTEGNPINNIEKRTSKIISTGGIIRREYAGLTDDPKFYVDYLISMIMVLDASFDLKFSDVNDVKKAIAYNSNKILDNCFEDIYNYAIDINPDPEDYVKIFRKIYKQ